VCIGSFLTVTNGLSDKAEAIAQQRVLTDIKYALSMMLYDYTIQGKQQQLKQFDKENPFVFLAIYRSLPTNYQGVIPSLTPRHDKSGWYFDQKTRWVTYIAMNAERHQYVLEYSALDVDSLGLLQLQPVIP
jgi:hypothetical protein